MKKLFYILISCFLLSCGNEFTDSNSPSDEGHSTTSMTPKKRELIDTNDIFSAIIDNVTLEEMEKILKKKGSDLFLTNKEGDTPLGAAIKLKKKEIALFLLKKFQCKDLNHQNHEEESYVYLASKEGYTELIKGIADICYENRKEFLDLEDYEFSDLDPEAKNGQKALHVAAYSLVVKVIFYGYNRGGMLEMDGPWPWDFYYHTDKEEQNFLHTAVKDNRLDVVKWVVKEECDEIPPVSSAPKDSDSLWDRSVNFLSSSWEWTSTKVQNFWNGAEAQATDLINDNDKNDNTPLSLAAVSLNTEAIHILSSCSWLDYSVDNNEGDIPLQIFLKNLTPSERVHKEELKEAFKLLANKRTRATKWFTDAASFVDDQNNVGDSSLHIAAGLADPFFYNYLKPFGNSLLSNLKEETPEEIFYATQKKIKGL